MYDIECSYDGLMSYFADAASSISTIFAAIDSHVSFLPVAKADFVGGVYEGVTDGRDLDADTTAAGRAVGEAVREAAQMAGEGMQKMQEDGL
jgi:hypothetical protein